MAFGNRGLRDGFPTAQEAAAEPKSFEESTTFGERLRMSFGGTLGNAQSDYRKEQMQIRAAKEQRNNQVKDQIFKAITQNFRESPGADIDKEAFSSGVARLYGQDSIQFQSLFNQEGTNVPNDELSALGGGPTQGAGQPFNPSNQSQGFDDPILGVKSKKPPKGKRINAQLKGKIIPAIENEQGHLLNPVNGERMPEAIRAPSRQATGSLEDVLDLSNKTKSDLEKDVVVSEKGLGRLQTISQQFDPKFLEVGTKFKAAFLSGIEKAGVSLDTEDTQFLTKFSKFKKSASGHLNRYVKEITGAQMSEAEVKRLMRDVPNPGAGIFDGDSPTVFKAKMDEAITNLNAAQNRAIYLRKNGFKGKPFTKITPEIEKAHPIENFLPQQEANPTEPELTPEQQSRLEELRKQQGAK